MEKAAVMRFFHPSMRFGDLQAAVVPKPAKSTITEQLADAEGVQTGA
jgi:hypothetical protein